MSEIEKTLVADYALRFKGLSKEAKEELIGVLAKSLQKDLVATPASRMQFSGYIAEKSAEEIIEDLRASRRFREKDLDF